MNEQNLVADVDVHVLQQLQLVIVVGCQKLLEFDCGCQMMAELFCGFQMVTLTKQCSIVGHFGPMHWVN